MATAEITIPVEGTIVDTFRQSFVDVPVDAERENAIATAESLTTIFDVMGSVALKPVKGDMVGNVKKVRERQLAAPAESQTLQELVQNELKDGKHVATEGLLWLMRGLEFTCAALSKNVQLPTEELSTSFTAAYASTLKAHHSWLVKPVFSAAMSAVPYRKDFYAKLGSDPERVYEELTKYLAALDRIVGILKGFFATVKW
jgi:hypothetical protein